MHRYGFLVLLLCYNVLCITDDCVTYNFEDNEKVNFTNTYGICQGMCSWDAGDYSSLPISPPHRDSNVFITPRTTLSCISSFKFLITGSGLLELNVYMAPAATSDQITLLVFQSRPGATDVTVGNAVLSPNDVNFQPGWQTIRIQVVGIGSNEGYITLLGMASEKSIVLIDSFRYVAPTYDIDACIIYPNDDISTTNEPEIEPTASTHEIFTTDSPELPTIIPTTGPTAGPTPTADPTNTPTIAPRPSPTAGPTPTDGPTDKPTIAPTPSPTAGSTPTDDPTDIPTIAPAPSPTAGPTPTDGPTDKPTIAPTPSPTAGSTPTDDPTDIPTIAPRPSPTAGPTPTDGPTDKPTIASTPSPTAGPTPTDGPTDKPTIAPAPSPTAGPTPTDDPTDIPTIVPTTISTAGPTIISTTQKPSTTEKPSTTVKSSTTVSTSTTTARPKLFVSILLIKIKKFFR